MSFPKKDTNKLKKIPSPLVLVGPFSRAVHSSKQERKTIRFSMTAGRKTAMGEAMYQRKAELIRILPSRTELPSPKWPSVEAEQPPPFTTISQASDTVEVK